MIWDALQLGRSISYHAHRCYLQRGILLKAPQRTCIGCRQKDSPRDLVRLVCQHEEEHLPLVVTDEHHQLPGRGAWIHRNEQCIQQAHRKGAFNRAFRARVNAGELVIET